MIGLQKHIIDNKVSVIKLAKEMKISAGTIWRWFNKNKVPQNRLEFLSNRLTIDEDYINKVVNDISTYKPKIKEVNDYIIENDILKMILQNTEGITYEVLIDLEDWDKVKNNRWSLSWNKHSKDYYITCNVAYHDDNGKYKERVLLLHRLIMDAPKGTYVDHENHNPRDNRKFNLRITTNAKNTSHRNTANSNSSTGHRNVNWGWNREYYRVAFMKKGVKYTWDFPLDKFQEACDFSDIKRVEIFGEFAGNS